MGGRSTGFTRGEETAPDLETHAGYSKSYVRLNLLSTKNAIELPKCGKSLHSNVKPPYTDRFSNAEHKAKETAAISRLFAGLAVAVAARSDFLTGLIGRLPEIWPLRCSRLRESRSLWRRLDEWDESGN